MRDKDPTKDEVYHRCPLFGDIASIYELIDGRSPFGLRSDLAECLRIVSEARAFLIYSFLPNDPSSHNYYFCDPTHFSGKPFPDPELVEKQTGYPAALLKSLRLIYWRAPEIESLCTEDGVYNDMKAININEEKAVQMAKDTWGVEPKIKQMINSKIVFKLFALKKAMMAIYTDVVWNKPIRERGPSQEFYKEAVIYLERVKEIDAREKAEEKEAAAVREKNRAEEKEADAIREKNRLEDRNKKRNQDTAQKGGKRKHEIGQEHYNALEAVLNRHPEVKSLRMFQHGRRSELRKAIYSEAVEATKDRDEKGNVKKDDKGLSPERIGKLFRKILEQNITYSVKP